MHARSEAWSKFSSFSSFAQRNLATIACTLSDVSHEASLASTPCCWTHLSEKRQGNRGEWDGCLKSDKWRVFEVCTHRFLLECGVWKIARLCSRKLMEVGPLDNLQFGTIFQWNRWQPDHRSNIVRRSDRNIQNWANWIPLVPWNPNLVSCWHMKASAIGSYSLKSETTSRKNSDFVETCQFEGIATSTLLFGPNPTMNFWRIFWYCVYGIWFWGGFTVDLSSKVRWMLNRRLLGKRKQRCK